MSNPLNTEWPKIRLKFIAPLRNVHIEATSDHEDYIGLENVQSWTGRTLSASSVKFSEQNMALKGTANVYYSGDILFGKLRPYLAKALYADRDGICTTELIVLIPRKEIYPKYLLYSLLSSNFIEQVDASTIGAKMPRANWEFIGSMKLPVPNYETQTKIANYLDRKTAEIDQLIGAKQRLLKLLDEKKRTLIARAVTRGLNPDAPLKDSGIPWLGMIPAHWEKTIVKRLFKFAKRQDYPDLEVLSVYREYGVILKSSRNDNNNRTPEDLTKYQLVEPGDLVINKMKAWQGSMGISKYTGITSPDYVVYEKNHNEDGEFLHYLFRAPFMPNVYRMFSNGIRLSQWRLEPEYFENLILFLPPVEEQSAIIAVVKKQLGKLDALKLITEKTITLLQERRTALISAAVTGKLSEEILNAGIETQNDAPVPAQTGEHNLCLT